MQYYSDRNYGLPEKNADIISPAVWTGIAALINSFLSRNYFASQFPIMCDDGNGPCGTDESLFIASLKVENPSIDWPLVTKKISDDRFSYNDWAPDTTIVLDLIEFCYNYISMPIQGSYHQFFKHYHLSFNKLNGQSEFIERVNTIFDRNGIMYSLDRDGHIYRNNNEPFDKKIADVVFMTGDSILDNMLNEARKKYLNPEPQFRRESVERLWDAWERLKTLKNPQNKQKSIEQIIQLASSNEQFRGTLNEEAISLTNIGNKYMIRHTEIDKIPINNDKHWDYLFQRMFAIIMLFLSSI